MSSARLANLLGFLSLVILFSFSLLPDSFSQMVRWPGVAIWQFGFILSGISLSLIRQYDNNWGFGKNVDRVIIGSLIVVGISSATSTFPRSSFWYFGIILGYILIGLMLRKSSINPIHLAYSVAIVGVISSILSIINWYPIREYTMVGGGYQNKFMLGHHNFVGGYLVIIIGILIGFALYEEGIKRYLIASTFPILLVNLYTTSSRGAIIGLLMGILLILLFVGIKRPNLKIFSVGTVAVVVVGSLLATHPRVQSLISLNLNSSQLVSLDGNAQVRIRMWKVCLDIANKHPLTGVGLGNLSRVYNSFAEKSETLNTIPNLHQAHNTFFQFLAELGWIGGILYFIWILLIWKIWQQAFMENTGKRRQMLIIGIGIGLSAYILSSLTDYQLENIPISLSLVVLLISLLKLTQNTQIYAHSSEEERLEGQLKALPYKAFVSSILLVMIIIQAPRVYGMYLGEQVNESISHGIDTQFRDKALQKLSIAHNLSPFDPIYSIQSATLLQNAAALNNENNHGAIKEIIGYYQKAFAAAPAVDFINFNLGYWLLSENPMQAIQPLKMALKYSFSSHYNYYCNYLLGYAYLLNGETENAIYYLTIQSLFDPAFLTYPLWDNPILRDIQPLVLEKTILLFESLPFASISVENIALLKWWFRLSGQINLEGLRPLIKGIILSDRDPEAAKRVFLSLTNDEEKLLINYFYYPKLLEREFSNYLENFSGLPEVYQNHLLESQSLNSMDFRDWFSHLKLGYQPGIFGLGSFISRNTTFGNRFFGTEILLRYWLPSKLNLWTPVSVYNPELNRFLQENYFPRL